MKRHLKHHFLTIKMNIRRWLIRLSNWTIAALAIPKSESGLEAVYARKYNNLDAPILSRRDALIVLEDALMNAGLGIDDIKLEHLIEYIDAIETALSKGDPDLDTALFADQVVCKWRVDPDRIQKVLQELLQDLEVETDSRGKDDLLAEMAAVFALHEIPPDFMDLTDMKTICYVATDNITSWRDQVKAGMEIVLEQMAKKKTAEEVEVVEEPEPVSVPD